MEVGHPERRNTRTPKGTPATREPRKGSRTPIPPEGPSGGSRDVRWYIDAETRAVIAEGRLLDVKRHLHQEAEIAGIGMTIGIREDHYQEIVDLWAVETKDGGLVPDLTTGEIVPHVLTVPYAYPRPQEVGPNGLRMLERQRVSAFATDQARYHLPVHQVIGLSEPAWVGTTNAAHLRDRRKWSRRLFEPERLQAFIDMFEHRFLLNWDVLDASKVTHRIELRISQASGRNATDKASRLTTALQRARAELALLRGIYVAVRERDMSKAKSLHAQLATIDARFEAATQAANPFVGN